MVEELRALAARALVNATHGGTSAALRAAGYPEELCEQVAAHEFCVHFTRAANCSTCALFGRTLTCFHYIPPYVAPSPVSTLACEQCEEPPATPRKDGLSDEWRDPAGEGLGVALREGLGVAHCEGEGAMAERDTRMFVPSGRARVNFSLPSEASSIPMILAVTETPESEE